jgi:hypothetical protein
LDAGEERSSVHSGTSTKSPDLKGSTKGEKQTTEGAVSPPGYIQSLVSKVIQNVALVFNNVVLKVL